MTTVGSLCSGYGGLDLGLALGLGVELRHAWHVEYDKHPSAILAHRFPGVPNYGDVKTTDWSALEPVDWLTAGYPCQPFSLAGLRKGADDPRHLWPGVARAISVLRPRGVLLENVAAHLRDGFDTVLGDLAEMGYDATWGVVRASDAGAPHGRARLFVLAHAQGHTGRVGDGDDVRARGGADGRGQAAGRGAAATDAGGEAVRQRSGLRPGQPGGLGWGRPDDDRASAPAAYTQGDGRREGRTESAWQLGRPDAAVSGLPAAPHAHDADGRGSDAFRGSLGRDAVARRCSSGDIRGAVADPDGSGRGGVEELHRDAPAWLDGEHRGHADGRGDGPHWGPYTGAVRRWEHVTGRAAPRPTEPGRTGERLSPRFVEWLMGLPAGWVTDVPGLPRNAQLKALGNGVVPQQAALAVRLLSAQAEAVAA